MHSNLKPVEGTVNGELTIEFAGWKAKKIVITNDSVTSNLQFKFSSSETYATLKPTETFSAYASVRQVILYSSTNVDYRVWGIG